MVKIYDDHSPLKSENLTAAVSTVRMRTHVDYLKWVVTAKCVYTSYPPRYGLHHDVLVHFEFSKRLQNKQIINWALSAYIKRAISCSLFFVSARRDVIRWSKESKQCWQEDFKERVGKSSAGHTLSYQTRFLSDVQLLKHAPCRWASSWTRHWIAFKNNL